MVIGFLFLYLHHMKPTITYTQEQLTQLHAMLHEILAEIIRVCEKHRISYFMIGGSAIGVHFWQDIIPFDDDIDIGMMRPDYERFLSVAPQELDGRYFLQTQLSERHMPYYFAKVRRNGTRFVEEVTQQLDIHHGIFIDIIPFDKIPESPRWQRLQWKAANALYECLMASEIPSSPHYVHPVIDRWVVRLLPKRVIYRLLKGVSTCCNRFNKSTYNNVLIHADHIPAADLQHLQTAVFGQQSVTVPDHLESYLHYHYPKLKKHLTQEEIAQYAHGPVEISFGKEQGEAAPPLSF